MTPQNPLVSMFGPPPDPAPLPPPKIPKAKYTPMTEEDIALTQHAWDPFNKAQHEANMNAAYMRQTEQRNGAKIRLYMGAYNDWATNAVLYAACRPPIEPPPPPVCQPLEDVGPMPTGYWFGTHA